jgi:hypothetical protein
MSFARLACALSLVIVGCISCIPTVAKTYAGHYIVADLRLASPAAPDEGTVVVSPQGFVLFGPLPGNRWIIFVNIDESHAASLTRRRAMRSLRS